MKIKNIVILGGTGFVGGHLVNRLTQDGYAIRVLTRHRERHKDLLVIPKVALVEADIHDPEELKRQLAGSDAVINLVGILNETGDDGGGFRKAHVDLAREVVEACQANGVRRLLHMSALNADQAKGASHYLQTKGEAEDLVHAAATEEFRVTSFRPSVIFGPRDDFFNRFAQLLHLAPYFFPLACSESRFAPVYVGDVAEAFAKSLEDPHTFGQRYDLCGPHDYSLRELVEYAARTLSLNRRIIPLNEKYSHRQAQLFEHVPGKPFSLDNFRSLQVNSVYQGQNGLTRLGITPTSLEAVVPAYLAKRTSRGRYSVFRTHARRR
jgi:NADH dehydrogenase